MILYFLVLKLIHLRFNTLKIIVFKFNEEEMCVNFEELCDDWELISK